jgi:hypothetical protein
MGQGREAPDAVRKFALTLRGHSSKTGLLACQAERSPGGPRYWEAVARSSPAPKDSAREAGETRSASGTVR